MLLLESDSRVFFGGVETSQIEEVNFCISLLKGHCDGINWTVHVSCTTFERESERNKRKGVPCACAFAARSKTVQRMDEPVAK